MSDSSLIELSTDDLRRLLEALDTALDEALDEAADMTALGDDADVIDADGEVGAIEQLIIDLTKAQETTTKQETTE